MVRRRNIVVRGSNEVKKVSLAHKLGRKRSLKGYVKIIKNELKTNPQVRSVVFAGVVMGLVFAIKHIVHLLLN